MLERWNCVEAPPDLPLNEALAECPHETSRPRPVSGVEMGGCKEKKAVAENAVSLSEERIAYLEGLVGQGEPPPRCLPNTPRKTSIVS